MSWPYQSARHGNYELRVTHAYDGWKYTIDWSSETALTTVGVGSGRYDVYEARAGAVRHLANILPKAQSERLLASQSELVREEPSWLRNRHSSR
jgi:hypothetical protein